MSNCRGCKIPIKKPASFCNNCIRMINKMSPSEVDEYARGLGISEEEIKMSYLGTNTDAPDSLKSDTDGTNTEAHSELVPEMTDDFTKGLQKILRGPYAGLPFDQTDPISVIIKQLTALHTKGLIAAEKRGLALSLLQPGLTPAQQTWIEAQLSAKEVR